MTHKLRLITLLSLLLIFVSVVHAQQVKLKCGKERWPVKTGTDPDTSKIDFHPQTVTINDLQQMNNGQPFSQMVLLQHQGALGEMILSTCGGFRVLPCFWCRVIVSLW